ncbi:hypothetical protein [Bartonella rattaustraliani]|uniref:hypothetical protein n=1 Tax=Bartonella rattaustraliani TaxID=481139 RepID=UPI0002E6C207
MRESRHPIKEREKQKLEAIHNLHNLKDITVETLESRKTELKRVGKAGGWFLPLQFHVLLK